MSQAISQILSRIENEIVRLAPIAIIVVDSDNVIRIINSKALQLLVELTESGIEPEFVGRPLKEFLPQHDLVNIEKSSIQVEIGNENSRLEIESTRIEVDGQRWTAIYFHSSTQREQLLEKEASTDELSGLANRRAFQRTVEGNHHRALSLAIIDIDRFKSVNDDHGHLAGDDVIGLTSSLMTKCFADNSILLSRMGGDEFSVLFETSNAQSIVNSLDEFRQTVASSQLPKLEGVRFTVSIGAVISTVAAIDSRTLLTHADRQLYVAKEKGRNHVAHILLDESGTS